MTAIDLTFAYGDAERFAEVAQPVPSQHCEPVLPAAFPQRPGGLDALLGRANGEQPQDEHAFQVRVQAPRDATGLPVIVFVPGGGFQSGTGNARWFTAPGFVERHRMVLVTLNYRLGVLGLLGPAGASAADSARPVRDVLQVLRWVQAHIAGLGGDPGRVTLAGDSAGAWISYALAALPAARGLFRRAALVSLPWDPPLSGAAYADRAASVAADLATDGGPAAAPVERILDAQGRLTRAWSGRGMPLLPAAGQDVPADLHDFAASVHRLHVDALLLLSTPDEAAAFLGGAPEAAFTDTTVAEFLAARFADPDAVAAWIDAKHPGGTPKRRMIEAMTLHQFRLAHLELAAEASVAGIPVQLGSFSIASPAAGGMSPHCLPLPFLFANRSQWADAPMLDGIDGDVFDHASAALGDWFAAFARGSVVADFDPARPERWVFDSRPVRRQRPAEIGMLARR